MCVVCGGDDSKVLLLIVRRHRDGGEGAAWVYRRWSGRCGKHVALSVDGDGLCRCVCVATLIRSGCCAAAVTSFSSCSLGIPCRFLSCTGFLQRFPSHLAARCDAVFCAMGSFAISTQWFSGFSGHGGKCGCP